MEKKRSKLNSGITVWLTGLSGSGKTTISKALKEKLKSKSFVSIFLDGDSIRSGINSDLGFSLADRRENVRRVAEIAKIMNGNGIFVIAALISPTNEIRQLAKTIIGERNFKLVFVDTPMEVCMERDTKGLYKKALKGVLSDFTGVSSTYEKPEDADIIVQNYDSPPGKIADLILKHIEM